MQCNWSPQVQKQSCMIFLPYWKKERQYIESLGQWLRTVQIRISNRNRNGDLFLVYLAKFQFVQTILFKNRQRNRFVQPIPPAVKFSKAQSKARNQSPAAHVSFAMFQQETYWLWLRALLRAFENVTAGAIDSTICSRISEHLLHLCPFLDHFCCTKIQSVWPSVTENPERVTIQSVWPRLQIWKCDILWRHKCYKWSYIQVLLIQIMFLFQTKVFFSKFRVNTSCQNVEAHWRMHF